MGEGMKRQAQGPSEPWGHVLAEVHAAETSWGPCGRGFTLEQVGSPSRP